MSVRWSDEQVREAIVQSFVAERFTVPLSELQKTRAGRRRTWISMAALATAAVVVGAMIVSGVWRSGSARPNLPAGTATAEPSPNSAPQGFVLDSAQAEADCRSAGLGALQQDTNFSPDARRKLPELRYAVAAGAVGAYIFADDRVVVECMRHGPDGTDVYTINLSDTVAPWLNAEDLLFASGNDDELGLTFVVGWVPAGATQVKVGPAYPLSAATEATIVRSTVSASGDWLPANLYLAVVPMVFDHSTIVVVVTLPDRSITKIDNLPPTSSPR